VDPRLDQDSRSVLLRGRIQNPEGELRPGMFGRIILTLREHATALWMPEQALLPQRDDQHSIRINDQWRICFEWIDGDAYEVEIVDYH
jgi:RelE-like toxin of type II toxin-antitoxin system HigB